MALGARAAIVAFALASVALLAIPSACVDVPTATCSAKGLTAYSGSIVNGAESCVDCLQTECCEELGVCNDKGGCNDAFKKAHACVIAGGSKEEARCLDPLAVVAPERSLYDCMRSKCGDTTGTSPCGISNCNVDPSVILFSTPRCDRCINGSCCSEVNACYGDRRCKLALECIFRDCKSSLGPDLDAYQARDPNFKSMVEGTLCADKPLNLDAAGQAALGSSCIIDCIQSFAPFDGTVDDSNARCLAIRTYACGASNGCGAACAVDGGPAPFDAGDAD